MARKFTHKHETKEGINFFIPMVDLMVSIVFVFIIIVMVLLLLIKDETSAEDPSDDPTAAAAKGQEIPVTPAIIDDALVNQSAQEILFNDIVKDSLKRRGNDSKLNVDDNKFEIKILKPKK